MAYKRYKRNAKQENGETKMDNKNTTTADTNETTQTKVELSTTAIQAALAATRARKAAPTDAGTTTEPAKVGRARLSDEDRAARDALRNKERSERKAQRDAERAEAKAKKEAEKTSKVAHMAKVEKAGENLPKISNNAANLVNDVMKDYGPSDITAIIAHLTHHQRAAATAASLSAKLVEGQIVRIQSVLGADARYQGELAEVLVVQRIRCYVRPLTAPIHKRVYLFNNDVQILTDEEIQNLSLATSSESTLETVAS